QKLGADADLILQVSYLDVASRRSLAGISSVPAAPQAPATPQVPPVPGTPAPEMPVITPEAEVQRGDDARPRIPRAKRREAVVRIGGSVTGRSEQTHTGALC